MKIKMHFPKTKEGKQALQERVAEAHARMIKNYIEKLQCSPEEKIRLFNQIKEDIRIEAEKAGDVSE
ncbi:hypothetical protein R9X47_03260 [Wukongibacter baidiensis]|uniref:hypothetical protein n=1 Tax=Wukongibacter baidiensis TaxID=1723361 RepID=UPI003D7F5BA7